MSNRLTDGVERATHYAGEKAEAARTAAGEAIESARETAAAAGRKTAQAVSDAPIVALVGGLAVGAIAGALLPRTQRETDLLAPVGGKINDAARNAASAAKQAGIAKLDELGINTDNAKAQAKKLVDAATQSASSAGSAAASAIKAK